VTPEDWERIQVAFRHAADLGGPARDAYLETFARDHPGLGAPLRDLLAADASDLDLSGPIAASVQSLLEGIADPWIGRQIGAWTIRRLLGRGGMGAVYDAERTDRQFEQRVAIKLMSAQLLEPHSIARFKAERQILAHLSHPYIAQLHDGGTTDEGLPYLVMEYVEGLPIDRYCDEHRLDVDARLELLRKVCAAVDYAHRQLTVHRDLKPSNILVDAHGNPKLLDFGIAKLLDARDDQLTVAVTRVGARAMTPEYASPEQVRGRPISVASDVYSLGVLLYRLMTGQSPYRLTDATPLDYERAIVEREPKRPSTVVVGAGASAPGPQGLTPRQLRKRLAGDLDNIVMKALQKEPERRYRSASALSDDLAHFLRKEPVEARGTDWSYVAAKFVERNARSLAAAAAVVAGALALVTFYTLRLADERDRANLAAQRANEVTTFLSTIFDSASPLVRQGEEVTAVDLLEQGTGRIEQLADQPALQAELYRVMGASFTQLGEFARGRALLEKSLALRDGDASVTPLALARTLEDLAEAQRQLRDYEPATANLRRALALRRSVHGEEHAEVARVMSRLGSALGNGENVEASLETLQAALAMKQRLGDGPDIVTSDILGNLAVRLDTLGRYDEAAEMGRQAIAMSETVNGPQHPYTLVRMSNQALVLLRQRNLDAAAELFAETIRRARQTWSATDPRLASYIQHYAQTLQLLGRHDEALPLLQEAAEKTRQGSGGESLEYVARLYGIGGWHLDKGNYADAIRILREARDLALRLQDENGYYVVLASLSLGGAQLRAGERRNAERNLRRVIANEDRMGRNLVVRAAGWLAVLYALEGRSGEGLPMIREALADDDGRDDASWIQPLTAATEYYRLAGDLDESLALGERAHRIALARLPPRNWVGALASEQYGRSLVAAGRRDEARPIVERAALDLEAAFGSMDARVKSLRALAK